MFLEIVFVHQAPCCCVVIILNSNIYFLSSTCIPNPWLNVFVLTKSCLTHLFCLYITCYSSSSHMSFSSNLKRSQRNLSLFTLIILLQFIFIATIRSNWWQAVMLSLILVSVQSLKYASSEDGTGPTGCGRLGWEGVSTRLCTGPDSWQLGCHHRSNLTEQTLLLLLSPWSRKTLSLLTWLAGYMWNWGGTGMGTF